MICNILFRYLVEKDQKFTFYFWIS